MQKAAALCPNLQVVAFIGREKQGEQGQQENLKLEAHSLAEGALAKTFLNKVGGIGLYKEFLGATLRKVILQYMVHLVLRIHTLLYCEFHKACLLLNCTLIPHIVAQSVLDC